MGLGILRAHGSPVGPMARQWPWTCLLRLCTGKCRHPPPSAQAKSKFKTLDDMKVVYQKRLHCQRCIEISIVFNSPIPSEYTMLNNVSVGGKNGYN